MKYTFSVLATLSKVRVDMHKYERPGKTLYYTIKNKLCYSEIVI